MILILFLFSSFASAGELDGVWQQACNGGYQRAESFSGNDVEFTEINFRDVSCGNPAVKVVSRGLVEWGNPVALPQGARELDFTFSSVSLLPLDQGATDFYESISLCGLKGWKLNEEKEITGLSCEFFGQSLRFQVPKRGDKKFGIVKKEPERIFFGRLSPERDGSSPDRRPLVLDPSPYQRLKL